MAHARSDEVGGVQFDSGVELLHNLSDKTRPHPLCSTVSLSLYVHEEQCTSASSRPSSVCTGRELCSEYVHILA